MLCDKFSKQPVVDQGWALFAGSPGAVGGLGESLVGAKMCWPDNVMAWVILARLPAKLVEL